MTADSQTTENANLVSIVKTFPWVFYMLGLLALGWFQFHDARNLTWLYDDYDFLAHIEAMEARTAHLFSPEYDGGGRLTTVLFLYVVRAFSGESQLPYHIVHILCYILACWTLAWTLFQLGSDRVLSMAAGVLSLCMVSHYSVPYWLSCFAYVTCLVFGCLAIVTYTRYVESGSSRYLAFACLAILLSTLSHAGSIGFAALAAYFSLRSGGKAKTVAWSIWLLLGISAGLSLSFLFIFPSHAQNVNVARIDQVWHIVQFVTAYLGRAYLSPFWMTTTYVSGPNGVDQTVGACLIAAGVAAFVWRRGVFCDAIAMSLFLLPAFGGSTLDEYRPRYFYYANVGPALLYAAAIMKLAEMMPAGWRTVGRARTRAVMIALVIGLSHVHFAKTEHMHGAVIGRDLISRGELERGVKQLQASIDAVPELLPPFCYTRFALVSYQVGVSPGRILETGRRVYPAHTEIGYLADVVAYIDEDRPIPDALIQNVRADGTGTVASVSAILNNVGAMRHREGYYRVAGQLYEAAMSAHPSYFSATINYANVLLLQGQVTSALTVYDGALKVDKGRAGEALFGLRKIVAAEPGRLEARRLLINALVHTGALKEAIAHIEAGIGEVGESDALLTSYHIIIDILKQDGQAEAAATLERRIRQLQTGM